MTSQSNQKGFSLIELLIVVAIILIIAAIAIPNLLHARGAANQASAVSSIRTINSSMIMYMNDFPNDGYAPTLAALGGTSCTPPDPTSACLIDSQLASGTKSGYSFTSVGLGGTPAVQYFVAATPIDGSAYTSYCSTEDGVIHFDPNGAVIADHDSCLALEALQN
ncbi:MAG: prepilin-type N-terminal cleavage/methylation domain-containing protein [Acidobacteria bacterium]|nr:prepilin-type N-terminal cleavage/methylation domain-containing protein [Acidobacteriota bacterium]